MPRGSGKQVGLLQNAPARVSPGRGEHTERHHYTKEPRAAGGCWHLHEPSPWKQYKGDLRQKARRLRCRRARG